MGKLVMEKEKMVSIIVPVYNTALFLDRCIKSVQNGTYQNWEMICINDGSTDNSLEILREFEKNDERIHVISQINEGLSSARNRGIEQAQGEWLFYLDSDDFIHKNALEILIQTANKSGADIVVGGFLNVFTMEYNECEQTRIDIADSIFTVEEAIRRGVLRDPVWGTLYKRKIVDKYRFPEKKDYGEDAFYNLQIISTRNEITYAKVEFPLYYYQAARIDSIMNSASLDKQLCNIKWWIAQINVFHEKKYAISYISKCLYHYKVEAQYCKNSYITSKNVKKCMKIYWPYLIKCNLNNNYK